MLYYFGRCTYFLFYTSCTSCCDTSITYVAICCYDLVGEQLHVTTERVKTVGACSSRAFMKNKVLRF